MNHVRQNIMAGRPANQLYKGSQKASSNRVYQSLC